MAVKCADCLKPFMLSGSWEQWLKLVHFIQHLYDEGEITEATYHSMLDALMYFKRAAEDQAEKHADD